MVNECNVMLSILTYKRGQIFELEWKMKAERNVRNANIFTFKVQNQEILPIID